PAALAWTGAALFGGLALLFASVQLARGVERASAPMRRLLYGYNAVLTAVLLAVILALLNVLPYSHVWPFGYLDRPYDWTASRLYTLSDRSRNILTSLRQPVHVYLLMRQNDDATSEMITLLDNCRVLTDQLRWEALSPDRNRAQFAKLLEKYPAVTDPIGVLVV